MIITIRSGIDLERFGAGIANYQNSSIHFSHKKEREEMIENIFIIKKHTIIYTYIQEIIEEIILIADEMKMINQVELVRYDSPEKVIHYSGKELYRALIVFGVSVI